jgi:hypothetical protein
MYANILHHHGSMNDFILNFFFFLRKVFECFYKTF